MMNDLGIFEASSGEMVKLRHIQKDDAAMLVELFHNLSSESKRLRFHLYTTKLPEDVIWREAANLSNLDLTCRMAVVGTIAAESGREEAVGVARFARQSVEDTEAEVAIVVRDDFQRKGLGRHLLRVLADQARALGITHFTGWIMANNIRLMKLIKSMEEIKDVESDSRHGETKIRVPL